MKMLLLGCIIRFNNVYSYLTDNTFLIITPREDLLFTDVFSGFTVHLKQFSVMVSKTSINY